MADSTSYPNVMWPNYSTANVKQAASKETKTMGKDQFLKLLITQLRNQDPMQPLEDKEFIAQMAQFTSVEQLMNISSGITNLNQSLGSISGLIGKKVTWVDETSKDPLEYSMDKEKKPSVYSSGTVDSIVIRSGVQYAKIGDKEVAIDKILQIDNPPTTVPKESGNTGGEGTP
ncbi:flagellar hook capping protein [Paenibacillus sp. CAA11]|uniref:flagellar hook capping FlgD N-terminal domain-containing protein n=1 Tax=Paenibacillus sp. CAA11 TaxID=1532905 RepID=UPI000D386F1C|nr:flagellar hook capping FlgD N-terminal domain-containing protein [Paenibacillus sp. CAA11]AWB44299.1 flagellar hook capping protein [Paenibacillus sp. CAA11]